MSEAELKVLRIKRGQYKASLTKIKGFADTPCSEKTIYDIIVRLERLRDLTSNFEEVDTTLQSYDIDSELDDFETRMFEVTSLLRQQRDEKIRENNPVQSTLPSPPSPTPNNEAINNLIDAQSTLIETLNRTSLPNSTNTTMYHAKLPKVEVPSFAGDYKEWHSFKDLFQSCVGNRTDLTKSAKLQFLKGALKGEAANLVKHLLITDVNYDQAWDKLVTRYDKKRHIVSACITSFMNQPCCTSTSSSLRRLTDTSDQLIRGIDVLGSQASGRNPWLIQIMLTRLDCETRKAWAEETQSTEFPTFLQFISFLTKRCDALEALDPQKRNQSSTPHIRNFHIDTTTCPKCSDKHYLFQCPQFKALLPAERRTFVATHSLCFNCINAGHTSQNCKSRFKCHVCKKSHHTLLHNTAQPSLTSKQIMHSNNSTLTNTRNLPESSQAHTNHRITYTNHAQTAATQNSQGLAHVNAHTLTQSINSTLTLLPTALVHVLDSNNRYQLCRILLDSGSQASFISDDCVTRLGLDRERSKIIVHGLSSTATTTTKGKLSILITSRIDPEAQLWVQAHILSRLTAPQPSRSFKLNMKQFADIQALADPNFNISQKIDIILGADHFFQIIQDGKLSISPDIPVLQNTIFGYIVAGEVQHLTAETHLTSLHTNLVDIDTTLKRFWEIESQPECTGQQLTEEELYCENHFLQTHSTDHHTNRYVVKLPFKSDMPHLGKSIDLATSCFLSLERRFKSNSKLFDEYRKFMNEYEALGHMESISSDQLSRYNEHMYLPHHAVLKLTSTTTKVRVVFNGAATTSNGTTLNERLCVGPKIQPDLIEILASFRSFKIAIVADVEKMYRQVLVDESDRRYQRILWRDSPTHPIQHYQLTTVTYGTSSAPFLATRALNQLIIDFHGQFSLAENALKHNFYVDDLLGGANNLQEAIELQSQLMKMLNKRGFTLRKWNSNSVPFMKRISEQADNNESLIIDEHSESVRVLGLKWLPNQDCFSFDVMLPAESGTTKRIILSESSKVFDPLGLIAPVTVVFKIILQKLWLQNCGWDEPNEVVGRKWLKLRNSLPILKNLRISRSINLNCTQVQFHGFSDASELAYAAVIYCRSVNQDGSIQTAIVAAKTRVCPIKQLSVPRLELCAASLLTQLLKFVQNIYKIPKLQCFAWTDSTVVLSWLSANPRRWKSFVANRTSQILSELPRSQWHHVTSSNNPADLASRGLTPEQLINSTLWWNGPQWLKTNWEPGKAKVDIANETANDVALELRKNYIDILNVTIQDDTLQILFTRYSKLSSILHILSKCFLFIRKCNFSRKMVPNGQTQSEKLPCISSEDTKKTYTCLVKWTQQEVFKDEINQLKGLAMVKPSSCIASLSPFIDENGILRVGGRLKNSVLPYSTKHPVILPKDHIFVTYLVQYLHEKHLHPGVNLLLSIIRQQYWIISSRRIIKSVANKCIICVKNRGKLSEQMMANLPKQRLGSIRAFAEVGVDYAGPFELLNRRGKGARATKGYISLFVCFSTRAIHLELAGDLSTQTFLACFKRFIARRGIPAKIYSDNGTNFIGAKRYLNEIYLETIHSADLVIEIPGNLGQDDSYYRLDYSPPYGRPEPNTTISSRDVGDEIQFSHGLPGTTYNFWLFYTNSTHPDWLTWTVTITTAPDPPSNLSVAVRSGKTATITWSPPTQGNYTSFKIRILGISDNFETNKTVYVENNVFQYTARELTPGATYQVQAYTIYDNKESVAYTSRNFTTKPNTPGKFIVWFRNETTLLVLWQPPYPAGIYTHYKVSIDPPDAQESVLYVEKEGEPPGPAQAAFKGLIPGRAYNISVQTMSEDEISLPTTAQYRTVPLRPMNVTFDKESITSNSFKAMWEAPKNESEFDKYQVSLSLSRRQQTVPRTNEPIASLEFRENLEPGKTYNVIVKTVSGKVTSWPATGDVTLKPLPVRNLRSFTDDTTNIMTITWDPHPNSTQDLYKISYHEIVESINSDASTMTTDRTRYSLDNLLPGRNYTITVQAISKNMESNETTIYVVTRPSAPIIEDLKSIKEGLNISWKSDVNSKQEKYEIEYRRNGTSELRTIPTYENRMVIKNLFPGAIYEIKVFAVSHDGLKSDPHAYLQAVYPNPPRAMTTEKVTSNSVLVRWQPPDRSDYSEYSIRYRTESDKQWHKLSPVKTTEADVINMTPGEKYTIQVNSVSYGVESVSPQQVNQTVRPNPVSNIIPFIDSTNITLEWPRPEGRVEMYLLKWWPTDNPNRIYFKNVSEHNISPINFTESGEDVPYVRVLISDLMPGVQYKFDIRTISYGLTSDSTPLSTRTMPLIQSEVVVVNSLLERDAVTLSYTPTPQSISKFDIYRFSLGDPEIRDKEKLANNTDRKVTFTGLIPGRLYNITVWTVSGGVASLPIQRQDRLYPEPITHINATRITDTEITLKWDIPKGEYNAFEVQYLITDSYYVQNLTVYDTITIFGLKPHRNYTFTIVVRSGTESSVLRNSSPVSASFTTKESVPGRVERFEPIDVQPSEIVFEWTLPSSEQNGIIRQFSVTYGIEGLPHSQTRDFKATETRGTLKGLLPGTTYIFRIQAKTAIGYGPETVWKQKMPILAPPKPATQVVPTEVYKTSSSIQIRFRKNYFSDQNGAVKYYTIIVAEDDSKNASGLEMLSWKDVQSYSVWPPYQVVEPYYPFNNSSVEDFTIGTENCDNRQNGYCNGALKSGTIYKVKVRAFTAPDKFTDTAYSFPIQTEQDNTSLILAITIPVCLILIIVMAVVFLRKRRNSGRKLTKESRTNDNMSLPESVIDPNRPIPVKNFAEHYRMMSADSDFRFSEEFEELKHIGRDQPCTFADLPCNRPKNRFTNILPYDHSRFKLQPVDDDEGSDYINANYVPGHNSPREFIVTQGPLHSTRDDFWRMCWESNSRAIVMLTRCFEKGREKCDHYWPHDTVPVFYGDIKVQILNDSHYPDWVITEFMMCRGNEQRVIRHFHFTTWPDFGVPNPPQTLARFVRAFRERVGPDQRPIVVHCSAGVGRSGTFITLDRILQQIQVSDYVDIFSIVWAMRKERVWMVQTEQQYICIHQCLLAVLEGKENVVGPSREIHDNQGYEDDEGIAESGM